MALKIVFTKNVEQNSDISILQVAEASSSYHIVLIVLIVSHDFPPFKCSKSL